MVGNHQCQVQPALEGQCKYKLVRIAKQGLVVFRCADSNEASMDKTYYLADQTSQNLVKFADDLNNEELFPPLENGNAGMDCVEMEEQMVFGQNPD